jgi:2-dehydropantoate 2-reductase
VRYVILGAGAVGGTIAGLLRLQGSDVTVLARGEHARVMKSDGLTLATPEGTHQIPLDVASAPDELKLHADDVLLLATKTQHTESLLSDIASLPLSGAGSAAESLPVVCAQNGVENERLALRQFAAVYGICVMLPATFMEPGVVDANGAPHNAILDIGRYPLGVDPTAAAVASAFEVSGLVSTPQPAIMRFKYRKLIMNLANLLDALVSDRDGIAALHQRATAEADACFAAAGIDCATVEEDRARRSGLLSITPIDGRRRGGGSTWQSFARGATANEIDWLNGEIVLLGRQYGVPTPVNAMLQRLARTAAAEHRGPRSLTSQEIEALV